MELDDHQGSLVGQVIGTVFLCLLLLAGVQVRHNGASVESLIENPSSVFAGEWSLGADGQ